MKNYIGIVGLVFLLFSCNETEENKVENELLKEEIEEFYDYKKSTECYYKEIDDSLKVFPFENEIDKVLIVSYKTNREYEEEILNGNKIGMKNFKEEVYLSNEQIKALKNIYFGYSIPEQREYLSCYNPRHCIFFLNKKKEVIAYHEICFECIDDRTNNNFLRFSCYKQYDKMKLFLKNCGIVYNL